MAEKEAGLTVAFGTIVRLSLSRMKPKVFIALPTYGPFVPQALQGLVLPTQRGLEVGYTMQMSVGSLLAYVFNILWAKALNSRAEHSWTHFAMMHSDIEAPAGWLDTLMSELDRMEADVLSVVVPIKDKRGLTSTGLMRPNGKIRRLTMTEVCQLPETFDARMAGAQDDEFLAINTGLWICRFDRDWVNSFPGFTIVDTITKEADGSYRARTLPEDWHFSKHLSQFRFRVCATRKVRVNHYGPCGYANDHAWGAFETDKGDDYAYDPVTGKETTAA